LLAVILLLLLGLFSLSRIPYLPQFVDGYYHLSVAQGFIKSGGWVGWDWWDFAPLGRPHLYPPLYHLLLVILLKCKINNLLTLQITEALSAPVFFTVFWLVIRKLCNQRIAFFAFLISSTFFPLYVASTGNVPATMAMVLGFFGLLFFKHRRIAAAIVSLALAFYAHAAIPWTFICGYLMVFIFDKDRRFDCLKVIVFALIAASPLFYHQLRYLSYLHMFVQGEVELIQFSLLVFILAIVGIFGSWRNKFPDIFFIGFLLGVFIVFFKYPYRIFSAQGMAAAALMAAIGLEKVFKAIGSKRHKLAVFFFLGLFLFFHPVLHKPQQGKGVELKIFNSTYYRLMTGRVDDFFMFNSLFFPKLDMPVATLIDSNTSGEDIIASNYRIMSQTFSALCDRANSYSMLSEVKAPLNFNPYDHAKIVVWLDYKNEGFPYRQSGGWKLLKASDIYEVYLRQGYCRELKVIPAKVPFWSIFFLLAGALFFLSQSLFKAFAPGKFLS